MNQEEHNLQCACVRWFRLQYPHLAPLLFAVPNGGARSKATAGKLKAEGVVAGVADLILLVPVKFRVNAYLEGIFPALCIEMKTAKGVQSTEQKAWQEKVESHGYKYAVCHSLDEFMAVVNGYLR